MAAYYFLITIRCIHNQPSSSHGPSRRIMRSPHWMTQLQSEAICSKRRQSLRWIASAVLEVYFIQRQGVKCGNMTIVLPCSYADHAFRLPFNSTHEHTQICDVILLRHECLQHGGVYCSRQHDVTVTPCISAQTKATEKLLRQLVQS